LSLVLRGNKKRVECGRALLSESAGRFEDGCRRQVPIGWEKKNEWVLRGNYDFMCFRLSAAVCQSVANVLYAPTGTYSYRFHRWAYRAIAPILPRPFFGVLNDSTWMSNSFASHHPHLHECPPHLPFIAYPPLPPLALGRKYIRYCISLHWKRVSFSGSVAHHDVSRLRFSTLARPLSVNLDPGLSHFHTIPH
jgi:hypothetical protein